MNEFDVRHRLSRLKHLVVEPRDQSQFAAARIDFEEKINGTCGSESTSHRVLN